MLTNKYLRPDRLGRASVLLATGFVLSACASHRVEVAPRMDLTSYDRIALVTFASDPGKSSLGELATQRFSEAVLDSQHGFQLLELGAADSAVARLLAAGDAPEAARRLGQERQVPAVFFGQLSVTNIKPDGTIGGGGSVSIGGTVSAQLNVRLLNTGTGGTLWRASASESREVGRVTTAPGRLPSISGTDPNAAYADMIEEMAVQVTRDFRPTWVKQK